MSYKQIDMETYPRKAHFEHFRTQAYPYVGITADVDVTEVLDWCHAHNRSFYLTFMHIAALAADEVPEFRRRIHDGESWSIPNVRPPMWNRWTMIPTVTASSSIICH